MTPRVLEFLRRNATLLMRLLPLVAFAVPLLWLYLLQPGSFELMWKGRTFELFFVWLILLEIILGWESLQPVKVKAAFSSRSFLLVVALLLPTVFVVASNYMGLSVAVADTARQSGIYWWSDMPIAVEYVVFAAMFSLMAILLFGGNGLKFFSIPILFSALIGGIFIIDNVYPYDQFTPFQFLVPMTTWFASNALSLMGYSTSLDLSRGNLPSLTVTDPNNTARTTTFAIAWPCAGIESLLIFTVTILLFLKRMPISWKAKVGYFAFGAMITYFINILRIASIYLVSLNGGNVDVFHSTYGPLYPIAWIVSYPLIIMGSQTAWQRLKKSKPEEPHDKPADTTAPAEAKRPQQSQPSLA